MSDSKAMTSSGSFDEQSSAREGKRRFGMFWLGTVMVCVGTALHFPMYIHSRHMDYMMAGMSADKPMIIGMALIVAGLPITAYGLFPRRTGGGGKAKLRVLALDDAPIGRVHVRLLLVMAIAITIDVMKPTSLAFVSPGMVEEYGLKSPANPTGGLPVALLPLSGITGTVIGSFTWGWLGDRIGRRASMLLAGVAFVGTAVCGTMPSFKLNMVMCFLMGLAAGGMLPIAFTLLAETIPARHRGWLTVLIGGDVAGAFILTSWLSAELVPTYSWRILWLIGMPTGILLILLTLWIPESPRYLLSVGREAEARAVLDKYNAVVIPTAQSELEIENAVRARFRQLLVQPFVGLTMVIALVGLGIGLVVYGFQLWLPSNLRQLGFNGVSADKILRDAALFGFPLNFLVAFFYHRSSRYTMIGLCALTLLSLTGFVILGDQVADNRTVLFALLVIPIWGASSVVAVLSAYCVEVYPTRIRSRGSGVAAGMSKAGGVLVIFLVVTSIATPSISVMALVGAVPLALAIIAAVIWAIETRQRRLEEITAEELNLLPAPARAAS